MKKAFKGKGFKAKKEGNSNQRNDRKGKRIGRKESRETTPSFRDKKSGFTHKN